MSIASFHLNGYLSPMKKAMLVLALASGSWLKGQVERPSGFDNSSRDVISGTDIRLLPASKIRIEPEVPTSEMPKIKLDFSTPTYNWETAKHLLSVEPDIVKESNQDSVYLSNYARLGGGNNGHLLGEIFLSNRPNGQWSYNLSALHLQGNTPKNNQMIGQTRLQMNGARYFENSSLNANLFYNRDQHTYYNLLDTTLGETDSTLLGDLARNGKIAQHYGMHIDYLFLEKRNLPEIKWLNTAQMFQTNAGHEELEINSTLKFLSRNKKFSLFGDLAFTFFDYQTQKGTDFAFRAQQLFVDFNPKVQFFHKPSNLDAQIGVNLTFNQHSTQDASDLKVNPFVYVEKGISELGMKLYGGVDGGLRKTSLRRIHELMPYYGLNDTILNTYDQINGYLGIKGKISENSLFHIDFGGNTVADMLMFAQIPDTAAKNASDAALRPLKAVYRDISSIYFRAGAEYVLGDQLKLIANIKITNFGADNQVLHLPSMEYHAKFSYKPIEDLKLEFGAQGVGRRFDQIYDTNGRLSETEVAGFTDLFARVDYRFIGKGRIWIQGSNLLNNKYQYWNGYQVWGLTVMGGISLGLF